MKFRHVFLTFGAIIALCAGGTIVKNAAKDTTPYPESTAGLMELSNVFDKEMNRLARSTQDAAYYDPDADLDGHVHPLAVEALPFAYSQSDIGDAPRYYRVKGTDDWIYSYWKASRHGGGILDLYYRGGAKMPSPEQAAQLYLSWGFPLPGEEADALFVTDDAFLVHETAQAIESEGVPPESLSRLRDVCSLQFRSEEYPGVGLDYRLRRDSKNNYYIEKTNIVPTEMLGQTYQMPQARLYPLPGELNQAIREALSSQK